MAEEKSESVGRTIDGGVSGAAITQMALASAPDSYALPLSDAQSLLFSELRRQHT